MHTRIRLSNERDTDGSPMLSGVSHVTWWTVLAGLRTPMEKHRSHMPGGQMPRSVRMGRFMYASRVLSHSEEW